MQSLHSHHHGNSCAAYRPSCHFRQGQEAGNCRRKSIQILNVWVYPKRVAKQFFEYLANRDMPDWEISNTLAKYYVTTKAVELAKEGN
ncbi:MAG TPA: hypothetical protein GXZ88_02720 [Firmicutes bacterium]|nr:hypothetical protein [Candidatus Fermentithermobacillaceae bacterium]